MDHDNYDMTIHNIVYNHIIIIIMVHKLLLFPSKINVAFMTVMIVAKSRMHSNESNIWMKDHPDFFIPELSPGMELVI